MTQAPKQQINDYIAGFPEEIQDRLKQMRTLIQKTAPDAEEAMVYGVPTFKLNGNLVHYAAFKKHIGLYPTPSGIQAFKKELSNYELSEGTVRLPHDQPIPFDLIKQMVEFRVKENLEKSS